MSRGARARAAALALVPAGTEDSIAQVLANAAGEYADDIELKYDDVEQCFSAFAAIFLLPADVSIYVHQVMMATFPKKFGRMPGVPCAQRFVGSALVLGLGKRHSLFGRDAKGIEQALRNRGYDATLCMEKHVRKDVIAQCFDKLRSAISTHGLDTCVVYVGAHAVQGADGLMRMQPMKGDDASAGIRFDWLRDKVSLLPAKKVLFLVDCCYSGRLVRKRTHQERWWAGRSFTLVTSCGGMEVSECLERLTRSPFAGSIIDALAATSPVEASGLASQVKLRVPSEEDQTPMIETRGDDFCV